MGRRLSIGVILCFEAGVVGWLVGGLYGVHVYRE